MADARIGRDRRRSAAPGRGLRATPGEQSEQACWSRQPAHPLRIAEAASDRIANHRTKVVLSVPDSTVQCGIWLGRSAPCKADIESGNVFSSGQTVGFLILGLRAIRVRPAQAHLHRLRQEAGYSARSRTIRLHSGALAV
jgi:hypothetical protein